MQLNGLPISKYNVIFGAAISEETIVVFNVRPSEIHPEVAHKYLLYTHGSEFLICDQCAAFLLIESLRCSQQTPKTTGKKYNSFGFRWIRAFGARLPFVGWS